MTSRQLETRWPCTPYCSRSEPCAAECELPPPASPELDQETAVAVFDLAIKLQEALGERCHGHLRLPSGGGLGCRRIVNHPPGRGPMSELPIEEHAYGGFSDGAEPRTWTDGDMGATSHREWWALYGDGEMRRQAIKKRPASDER